MSSLVLGNGWVQVKAYRAKAAAWPQVQIKQRGHQQTTRGVQSENNETFFFQPKGHRSRLGKTN